MTDDEDMNLARSAYAAFNRGDVAGALEHLDPGIEWHMFGAFSRDRRVFWGHDGVREVFTLFAESIEDFRTEPQDFIAHGRAILVPVRFTGRQRASGEPFGVEVVQAWTIRDHKAIRLEVFASLQEAMAAVDGGSGSSPSTGDGRANR
jgi:ketosteroid isomerase-like protein